MGLLNQAGFGPLKVISCDYYIIDPTICQHVVTKLIEIAAVGVYLNFEPSRHQTFDMPRPLFVHERLSKTAEVYSAWLAFLDDVGHGSSTHVSFISIVLGRRIRTETALGIAMISQFNGKHFELHTILD